MSKPIDARDLWIKLIPKARLLGAMAMHCKDHDKTREELNNFREKMKNENNQIRDDSDSPKFFSRKQSLAVPVRVVRYTNKRITPPFHRVTDNVCSVCHQAMDQFKDVWYPCRVCQRVFHRTCVERKSGLHKNDVVTIERANSNIGWSCFLCSDLSLLLIDEEMKHLIEDFKEFDVKKDCTLSLPEFVRYKRRLSTNSITEIDEQNLNIEFNLMDSDRDGQLSWWEFVNHEAKRILARRDKNELIEMLTEKELMEARALFDRLDANGDDFITEMEAKHAYRTWYRRFENKLSKSGIVRDSESLELHVEQAVDLIMEYDTTQSGRIGWEDFLSGQALYLITSRPNNAGPAS